MVSIATRSSILAIVPETTEGTPVLPSAGTQFTALQDSFSLDPAFDKKENVELKSSIGKAKPILGAENPKGSFEHYIRHSGVEGQAPDYNDILTAVFGVETVNGTQRVTASGSTNILINAASGTGSDFPRGTGMLIKDPTNGYSIRVSHSRSVDAITPSFKVANAPGTGVSLGKCVTYSPANSGHQSLTVWHYVGNGGATQMVAGARVTDFSLDAKAGDLITGKFTMEGLYYFLDPVQITSSTAFIDFIDDTGTFAVSIPVAWYTNPKELADAVAVVMNAANALKAKTCTYDDTTGLFTITSAGTVFSILWLTGTNNANGAYAKLGFAKTDKTSALTYTGATAIDPTAPYTPTYDVADPLAAKGQEIMIGDQVDYACFNASSISFKSTLTRRVIESICATSGRSGSLIVGRAGTIKVVALLDKFNVAFFKRFREGLNTRFQYSFGSKTGGNWVPGKCGYLYLPDVTVTSYKITSAGGLATIEFELEPYVDSVGNGEMYLGFL